MKPQNITIDPFVEGDEWDGITAVSIAVGPEGGPYVPPADALARVTMRFRKKCGRAEDVVELSSEVATQVVIDDTEAWEFHFPPQVIAGLTGGEWDWQIQLRDASDSGTPKTYFAGVVAVISKV